MNSKYRIAIIGASGLVGRCVLKILEEKNLYKHTYTLFSSAKSSGTKIRFFETNYILQELTDNLISKHYDFAIFCAGSEISKKYIPIFSQNGCTCIDNSSLFRQDENVPLVIPEVNPEKLLENNDIIANPNCSTIISLMAIAPIHKEYIIKRIIYSTYQAASGAGRDGITDLEEKNEENLKVFPHSIYNNCIPHIDIFMSDGYTKEEHKMINETRKILNNPSLLITATTVRVPITNCHSISINIELEKDFDIYDIQRLLENSKGVILVDNPEKNHYPLAALANNKDEVFVGRIRKDLDNPNILNLFVVGDNLRKGAALNAVQILEELISLGV